MQQDNRAKQRAEIIAYALKNAMAHLFVGGYTEDKRAIGSGNVVIHHEITDGPDGPSIKFTLDTAKFSPIRTYEDLKDRVDHDLPLVFRQIVETWANQERPEGKPNVTISDDGKTVTIRNTGSAWDMAGALSMVTLVDSAVGMAKTAKTERGEHLNSTSWEYTMKRAQDFIANDLPPAKKFVSRVRSSRQYGVGLVGSIVDVVTHDENVIPLTVLPKAETPRGQAAVDFFREDAITALLPPEAEIAKVDQAHRGEFQAHWKEMLKTSIERPLKYWLGSGVDKYELLDALASEMPPDYFKEWNIVYADRPEGKKRRGWQEILADDAMSNAKKDIISAIIAARWAAGTGTEDVLGFVAELAGTSIRSMQSQEIPAAPIGRADRT